MIAHGYRDAIRDTGELRRLHRAPAGAALSAACRGDPAVLRGGAHEAVGRRLGEDFRKPFTGRTASEALGGNLFLLHGLGAFPLLTWNGPSWSISCEFWTYILFGAVVLAVGRSMAIFGALALAAAAALLVLDPPTMNVTYDYGLLRCLYGFFVGAVAYAVYERMRPERVGGRAAFGLEAAAIAGALLFVVVAGDNRASLLAPLVFAAVTLAFACQGGACSRALSASGFRRMGQLSYGIYMLHAFAVYAIPDGTEGVAGDDRRHAREDAVA